MKFSSKKSLILLFVVLGLGLVGMTSYYLLRPYSAEWGGAAYDNAEYKIAKVWLLLASNLGDTSSMGLLGTMYVRGLGTNIDPVEGEKWLVRAADANSVDAQSVLGLMYLSGVGLPASRIKAIYYLNKAAQMGDRSAAIALETIPHQEFPRY